MSIDEALIVLGIGLAFGIFFGYIIFKPKEKIEEIKRIDDQPEEQLMDDENSFYVQLPNNPEIREILIEEPLNLNHKIMLDDVTYKVIDITHKENGHTVFLLNWA